MPAADDFLQGWIDQLKTMQNCMIQVNTDTSLDLAKFYNQRHADLLLSALQRKQFPLCFFQHTNIPIPDIYFTNSATFHELLDLCYRPLVVAVVGLMRAEATHNGGPYGNMPIAEFGAVKTTEAFPPPTVDGLCDRLAASMKPLFQAGNPAFRGLLANPATTALSAAQSIV